MTTPEKISLQSKVTNSVHNLSVATVPIVLNVLCPSYPLVASKSANNYNPCTCKLGKRYVNNTGNELLYTCAIPTSTPEVCDPYTLSKCWQEKK